MEMQLVESPDYLLGNPDVDEDYLEGYPVMPVGMFSAPPRKRKKRTTRSQPIECKSSGKMGQFWDNS